MVQAIEAHFEKTRAVAEDLSALRAALQVETRESSSIRGTISQAFASLIALTQHHEAALEYLVTAHSNDADVLASVAKKLEKHNDALGQLENLFKVMADELSALRASHEAAIRESSSSHGAISQALASIMASTQNHESALEHLMTTHSNDADVLASVTRKLEEQNDVLQRLENAAVVLNETRRAVVDIQTAQLDGAEAIRAITQRLGQQNTALARPDSAYCSTPADRASMAENSERHCAAFTSLECELALPGGIGISNTGRNLIFLVSQPRAGSTMLQRVLASHSDIHSVSEPWLALPLIFSLRERGTTTDFDAALAHQALREFLQHLPEGENHYWEALRRMLGYLYACALKASGKRLFLDKTPRYYFVIKELSRVFPDARVIFLVRNPVAVLASILDTWVKSDDVAQLYPFRHDLLTAPRLILEGIRGSGSTGITVRYEELVAEPENGIRRLCDQLGLHFHPEMIEYSRAGATLPRWMFGDQGTVYLKGRPSSCSLDRWKQVLARSCTWRIWAAAYLSVLGADVLAEMGYSWEQLRSEVGAPEQDIAEVTEIMTAWVREGN
jgi:hypothetical protein